MEEGTNCVVITQESTAESASAVNVPPKSDAEGQLTDLVVQEAESIPMENTEGLSLSSLSEPVLLNLNPRLRAPISRHVASKWLKTAVLRQDPRVARHIPDTRMYSVAHLASMLNTYNKVVLKPIVGTGGSGLIMITKSEGHYSMRFRHSNRRFVKFSALVAVLRRIRGKRRYLIQRGISLATINGRPIDYRVKMVRDMKRWKTTAMVGRLARPGLFVTNLCRGGTLLTSAQGIRLSLSADAVKGKKREMRILTRLCIAMLERSFPSVGQFGFDYGIDNNGMIWIFEVNTRPH